MRPLPVWFTVLRCAGSLVMPVGGGLKKIDCPELGWFFLVQIFCQYVQEFDLFDLRNMFPLTPPCA